MNYRLHVANKEGTKLVPIHTSYSDEYAQRMCDLYLKDELAKNEEGRVKKFYRLHAKKEHTQEMALAYDIQCPKCNGRLKQIGRQLSFNELGLYTCPACNRYEEIIMGYFTDVTASPEYDIQFWNAARGKRGNEDVLAKGRISATGSYQLPASTAGNIEKAMTKESVFRNIATVIRAYKSGYRIVAKDCDDVAEFIPELGEIPVQDGMKDFNETSIESHKLAVFVKLEEDFVRDAVFSLERYLIGRFAKNFGKAEENAFINGTGKDEPTGILHKSNGAEVGVTTENLTYDDVISLYFSVEKQYRKHAVWMINDSTALILRTLKDANGNYLWNHNNDTILGKQVVISEYMPDAAEGAKPIAFGDFSYYWVVDRKPVSLRVLIELFAEVGQIGYLAYKFLEGKLIRKNAIKVIQMKTAE